MTAPVPEYSTHVYEMMTRLGIEPGAGVLPQFSLRYATAVRRCENCRGGLSGLVRLCAGDGKFRAGFLYER
jgi:hypothetical protein